MSTAQDGVDYFIDQKDIQEGDDFVPDDEVTKIIDENDQLSEKQKADQKEQILASLDLSEGATNAEMMHASMDLLFESIYSELDKGGDAYATSTTAIGGGWTQIDLHSIRQTDPPMSLESGVLEVTEGDRYAVCAAATFVTSPSGGERVVEYRLEYRSSDQGTFAKVPGTTSRVSFTNDHGAQATINGVLLGANEGAQFRMVAQEVTSSGGVVTLGDSAHMSLQQKVT